MGRLPPGTGSEGGRGGRPEKAAGVVRGRLPRGEKAQVWPSPTLACAADAGRGLPQPSRR